MMKKLDHYKPPQRPMSEEEQETQELRRLMLKDLRRKEQQEQQEQRKREAASSITYRKAKSDWDERGCSFATAYADVKCHKIYKQGIAAGYDLARQSLEEERLQHELIDMITSNGSGEN